MNKDKINKKIEKDNEEIKKAERLIQLKEELRDYDGEDRVVHIKERIEEIEKMRGNKEIKIYKSHLPTLDDTTEGFRPGQLIVLSGPKKNGKTSFCRHLTEKFSQQGKVLWFSYEETHDELVRKFKGDIDFYTPRQMASGNLSWIEKRILESKEKYNSQIVFIDHLDFLKDTHLLTARVSQNMSSYVGAIVQRLKRIAVEQELVIFLMCHITKSNWYTNDLPTSQDISDSRQIAQLADTVLMLIRKLSDKEDEIYSTDCILGVIENRFNGKTKKIKLQFENGIYKEETDIYQPTL